MCGSYNLQHLWKNRKRVFFREGDKCGEGVFVKRADDNEETVSNRLKVYAEQTEPIIDFYKGKGVLHRIVGGEDGPQRLTDEIISIITK